jgi:hypothetical protein
MPVIIDEVVISVDVSNRASGGAATPPSGGEDRQAFINECIERVMDILEQKKER